MNFVLLSQLPAAPPTKTGQMLIYADANGKLYVIRANGVRDELAVVVGSVPSHTHIEGDITNLVSDLAAKADAGHDQTQTLASGAYSPTVTNVANTSSLSATGFRYMRVGNHVTVAGTVTATTSSSTVTAQVGISLPVASNLTAASDVRGVSTIQISGGNAPVSGVVLGDAGNDRAELQWLTQSPAEGAREHYVMFMYIVQ